MFIPFLGYEVTGAATINRAHGSGVGCGLQPHSGGSLLVVSVDFCVVNMPVIAGFELPEYSPSMHHWKTVPSATESVMFSTLCALHSEFLFACFCRAGE